MTNHLDRSPLYRRWRELVLAATMLLGFVIAEIPANVKDYTQTSAKYDLEAYGGGGLAVNTDLAALDQTS